MLAFTNTLIRTVNRLDEYFLENTLDSLNKISHLNIFLTSFIFLTGGEFPIQKFIFYLFAIKCRNVSLTRIPVPIIKLGSIKKYHFFIAPERELFTCFPLVIFVIPFI